jgi:predicted transcriptional regulator
MTPEPAIFEDENESAAADEAAIAQGLADIEAGRVSSHGAVKRWLLSWGTPDELPPPKVGE